MKITRQELKQIIKEEVTRLQKKTILENRKVAILKELRMLRKVAILKELRMLSEVVSITEDGIVERLEAGLEELEDSLSSHGMGYHIVDRIEEILEKIGKEKGISTEKLTEIIKKANIEDSSDTEYNEHDEGTVVGDVTFNGDEILTFSSHDDGYGFRYDGEINTNTLRLLAQSFLKEISSDSLNEFNEFENEMSHDGKPCDMVHAGLTHEEWEFEQSKKDSPEFWKKIWKVQR